MQINILSKINKEKGLKQICVQQEPMLKEREASMETITLYCLLFQEDYKRFNLSQKVTFSVTLYETTSTRSQSSLRRIKAYLNLQSKKTSQYRQLTKTLSKSEEYFIQLIFKGFISCPISITLWKHVTWTVLLSLSTCEQYGNPKPGGFLGLWHS